MLNKQFRREILIALLIVVLMFILSLYDYLFMNIIMLFHLKIFPSLPVY